MISGGPLQAFKTNYRAKDVPSMIGCGSTLVMVVAFEVAGAGGVGVTEAVVDCKFIAVA